MDTIKVQGARTHNLKNIDVSIPRDKFIVITGLSGSGKSSLAFDTLYAEGQRRYVESLSAYARQFLSRMEKPDVDAIEGLSPAIAIEQKTRSHNPRSTVGTMTEIYDYLRLLFARVGEPRCPQHGTPLAAQTISQMVDQVLTLPPQQRLLLLAPMVQQRKGDQSKLLADLIRQGYTRGRIDGMLYELSDHPPLLPTQKHTLEVVIDRFKPHPDLAQRLAESFEMALGLSGGTALIVDMDDQQATPLLFSAQFSCPYCGYNVSEMEPRLFSFNNPAGACSRCDGLGVQQFFDPDQVVKHPELSLTGGAIRGWDRRNFFYFKLLTRLAEHYQFDMTVPFYRLPPAIVQLILYGSEAAGASLLGTQPSTGSTAVPPNFEGVLPTMERRYQETESLAVRETLAQYLSQRTCPACEGTRLCEAARHVYLGEITLPQIVQMSIGETLQCFEQLSLSGQRAEIASKILKTVCDRLHFLVQVGLDYLTLARAADTLSGGETQRIRLASQIGSGLVGVMYVLDEPSIGLHQRDNARLLEALFHLRDLGNTVIVVEHDEEAIRAADHIIDMGPGAGLHGGELVAQGSLSEILAAPHSLTGQFLSGRRAISIPQQRRIADPQKVMILSGASGHNLQTVTVTLPIGLFTCVTGVSGSGKSTLINQTLLRLVQQQLNPTEGGEPPAPYHSIEGLQHLDKVIAIDQSPIGRTPRSNPATYTGLFTPIRELFAGVPEARARGYLPARFSFNLRGGRCEACQGEGEIKVAMHFLPDIYVACDHCQGTRYNRETLAIKYKNQTIHQVLQMSVAEAHDFFGAVPVLARKLKTLIQVGLSYVQLGQAATTLSGGEAQRIKLSRELSKRATGQTLYILDEPTTGLHFADIQQLLAVLHQLRDQGNTVVVIEHNMDVIKTADWIVDLGPEGGSGGGQILVMGTPEQVAEASHSHTARFLKPLLTAHQRGNEAL
jgi:excinuclease ABC subunit A